MAELADFHPEAGHRHDCLARQDCDCIQQLFDVALDLSAQLAECDQAVRDAEG